MNAVNYNTNKDFRSRIDIKQKIKKGSKIRNIRLPLKEFSYGMKNKTFESVKEIVNNEYGNKAEKEIRQVYNSFIKEKNKSRSMPKISKQTERLINLRKSAENIFEKPLYKHRMFRNINSKVTENLKSFKTYYEEPKRDLDKILTQVQKDTN